MQVYFEAKSQHGHSMLSVQARTAVCGENSLSSDDAIPPV